MMIKFSRAFVSLSASPLTVLPTVWDACGGGGGTDVSKSHTKPTVKEAFILIGRLDAAHGLIITPH